MVMRAEILRLWKRSTSTAIIVLLIVFLVVGAAGPGAFLYGSAASHHSRQHPHGAGGCGGDG